MSMRSHFALQLVRLINQRLQLFKRVLRRADRVTFRQNSASRTRLYGISAIFDLIADRRANLFWPIGNALLNPGIEQSRPKAVFVAVSTTNTDCMTRAHHPWSRSPTLVDRFAQRHVVETSGSADIPHAREAGHQSRSRMFHTQNRSKGFEVSHRRVVARRIAENAADHM